MNLSEKVRKTFEQYGLAAPSDRIVVGLSGGADSLCLAEILKELGYSLRAVHVHHGLRAAADMDEKFVRDYCLERGLTLSVVHVRAGEYSRENGVSTEEAGRILRFEAFEKEILQWEKDEPDHDAALQYHIALAHHREDSAETFLFNACRGSRIAGLSGIRPAAGQVIHPLLTCSREEIETYLSARKLSWCTDETNSSDVYTRNRTRHEILPLLEQELNPAAGRHIAEAALEVSECEDYLKTVTEEAMASCCKMAGSGGIRIDLKALSELHPFLQKRVIYETLVQSAGRKKDMEASHVNLVMRLAKVGGSTAAALPYGLLAVKTYDFITVTKAAGNAVVEEDAGRQVTVPGTGNPGIGAGNSEGTAVETGSSAGSFRYPVTEEAYRTRVFSRPEGPFTVPSGEYTKWFDYDKIAPAFSFRTAREGDRITIGKDGTRKRLSRCFIDGKVPLAVRKEIVLAASGDEILWIPGYRISAAYPVTEETKNILELCLTGAGAC